MQTIRHPTIRGERPARKGPRPGCRIVGLLPVLLLLAPALGAAQEVGAAAGGSVVGAIRDHTTGEGIQGAVMRSLDAEDRVAVSDGEGRFRLTGLHPGLHMIEIFHLAYGRTEHLVNIQAGITIEMDVTLGYSPLQLDSLVVEVDARISRLGSVGFHERQSRPWGRLFRADDPDMRGLALVQMLAQVPRVELVTGSTPFSQRVMIRTPRGYCSPTLHVDGHRRGVVDEDLDLFAPTGEVLAVEVYRGSETPPEFLGLEHPPCGAIVIWTR